MPKAPPPYAIWKPGGEVGADGQRYFRVMQGIAGLAGTWTQGFRILRELQGIKHPAAPAKVRLMTKHLAEMEKRIKAAEVIVAEKTDLYVKERIKATQVRPDPPRGPTMLNAIQSRPIRFPILPAFAVGAVDLSILDKATTRRGAADPYWPSQEFGSAHLVGRRVRGFFHPGRAAPDPASFRQHPIFTAERGGASMTIRRPIQERAFLRSGVMQGAILRRRMWKQIEGQAVREVQQVISLGGRPGRRRRRP